MTDVTFVMVESVRYALTLMVAALAPTGERPEAAAHTSIRSTLLKPILKLPVLMLSCRLY